MTFFCFLLVAVENTTSLIDRMCKYIYTVDSTDIIRTRAMLCHIYHHALHDRWYKARDLIMMSHLQNNIQHSDIPTQVSGQNSDHGEEILHFHA